MRKILLLEFMSLDGVIQAPGAPDEDPSGGFQFGGWTAPLGDDIIDQEMTHEMTLPFDLLLGRKTYDIFANYWPKHVDIWPGADTATKYVVSHSLQKADWKNSKIISGDVVSELKRLKESQGPDLQVYGSGNLAQTLFHNDLVDEMWLKIYPVLLGKGKRLFVEDIMPAAFKLFESKVTNKGVIIAKYKRNGEVKTGSYVD